MGIYSLRRRRRLACVVASLAAAIVVSGSAQAQTNWVGDASQDWNSAANWSSDPADPTGTFAINTAAAGVFPIVSTDSMFFPVDIFIANTAGTTARLDMTGGTLATGEGNWLRIGEGGGSTGTFNLTGGTFTGRVHGAIAAGVAATAIVNVSGTGTLTSPGEIVIADGSNNAATSQGTMNVGSGGTVNSEGDLILAWAGNANSFGELNIAAGATVNVASTVERWMIINQWDSQQGRLNVNGGTLNLNADTDIRFSAGNGVGTSVLNLNSGAIVGGATSVIDLNRNAGAVNNTVNLNGGTLTIAKVLTGSNTGTAVLNLNGGTLVASNNNSATTNQDAVSNFIELGGAAQRINVRNGGAKINSNGFDITISDAMQHSNVGGDTAIDGGLTKSGAGTLSITSTANTYTGPTAVNGGTLLMAGATATSGVTLSGGGGFGNISGAPVTVSSLAIGGPGSSLNVNLTSATPGIAITGALTTGGNSTAINATKTTWVNGANPLLSFGSLSGSLANFSVGTVTGLNARQVAGALTNTGNGFSLTINGDNPKWTGAASGVWSTDIMTAPKNWKLVLGGGNTDYLEGDAVEFDDSVTTGTTTVDIASAAGVTPTSVAFSNSTKAYTINGSGGSGINGSTSVVKSGTNSLTLNSNNGYTGGTTLNGGTLNINSATALGTGPLTLATGGTAKTLSNTSGAPVAMSRDGLPATNAQAWNDNFTFTGTVDGLRDLDMGTGAVTVGGTGTDRTVTVSAGTLAVGELKAATHGFVKQGAGTLAFTSTGPGVNGTNIAGTLNVAAGTVQINRTGATGLDAFTGDLYVGGLAGSGTITNGAGEVRWLFVNQAAATTSTFNGTLDNGAGGAGLGLYKEGAGTLTLGGVSTMTDRVSIVNGTLAFSGAGSLANASEYWIGNGAGVFKVDSASRIGGFQLINITSDGIATAPGAGSSGRLELSGNTTLTNPITFAPRNDANASDGIRNASGNNELAGPITVVTGGNQARIRSDAGLLTLSGGLTTTATGGRLVYLQGAGNGLVSGAIADNFSDPNGKINLIKQGAGTWTLSGFNTYTGNTVVGAGSLSITQSDILADTGDVSLWAGSTLNLTTGTTDTVDSLYLNGISVQPGVYNSANSFGLIAGSGSLNVLTYDLPGDFDNNNVVNADDLIVWKNGMTGNNALGDTDGDTDTDGNDFLIWQRYLGRTNPTVAASAAVPEPTSLVIGAVALITLAGVRRQRCVVA
jgi:autotransporter-associated beta strand protein